MRRKLQPVGVGERGDPQPFADATGNREVGLEHVDRTVRQQFLEVERGELAFARGDRQRARGAHLGETLAIIGRHRFLDEAQPKLGGGGAEALGLGDVERPVSIAHQVDVRAGGGARGADAREALVDAAVHRADAHLDRLEALLLIARELVADLRGIGPAAAGVGLDAVAAWATKEFEHGAPLGLPGEIPEGEVDAAHRRRVHPSPTEHRHRSAKAFGERRARAGVHARPQSRNVAGVGPDQHWAQLLAHDGDEGCAIAGAADGGLGLAIASEPILRRDRDEHGVKRGDATKIRDVLLLGLERAVQPHGVDRADLHGWLSGSAARGSSRPFRRASCRSSRSAGCCRGR